MKWQLAEFNVATLRAPLDDPSTQEFVDALDEINALAERSPGFVWRLQTADGNATSIKAFDDELTISNLSVWESLPALNAYVYRSAHVQFLHRRREWFEAHSSVHLVLWWIPVGVIPSIDEAISRLDELDVLGPTPDAFTFAKPFVPAH